MEEMLEDIMEILDDDELEEEVDFEVEKVFYELIVGKIKLFVYVLKVCEGKVIFRFIKVFCKNIGIGKEFYFN